MPTAKPCGVAVPAQEGPRAQDAPAPKRRVGRPPGEASTIVNVRLPLSLVARLDLYLARLEQQTGLKANRGMMARRALELFLLSHEEAASPSKRARRQPCPDAPFVPVRKRRTSTRPQVQ